MLIGARSEPGSPGRLLERAAMFQGARAVWNALFGNRARRKESALEALSLFRSRDAEYGPAFALALLRDSAQAQGSRRNSKGGIRRIRLSNSVTCLRCGRSKRSTKMILRKRSK